MDYSPFYCKNFYKNRKKQGKPPASGYNNKASNSGGYTVNTYSTADSNFSNPNSGNPNGNPTISNPNSGNPTGGNPDSGKPFAGNPISNNPNSSYPFDINPSSGKFNSTINGNPTGSNFCGSPINSDAMQGCYGGQSCGNPMQNNNTAPKPFALRRNKHKKRKGFFVTILIILCFAIVAVGADLFGGGFILDGLKSTFGTNYLEKHYFVAKGGFVTRQKAEQEAISVREGGAAGYVYSTDKGYYVVLSSYKDKKSAESVKGKNDGVEIIEVTLRELPKDNLSASQAKVCEKVQRLVVTDIGALYTIIEQLAKNTITSENAAAQLLDMRNELLDAKGELLDAALPTDIRNAYLNVAEPMFGGLDAVVFKEPDEYFVASLRYILVQAIAAFAQG